ncbi:cytochrome c oxidase assembly protein [Nocardioides sp.]|uniref:cytochrome c oxidase assembly protein n=1 Tax=Nocardioides sp. TaxID=35761 RepID=UPI003518520B
MTEPTTTTTTVTRPAASAAASSRRPPLPLVLPAAAALGMLVVALVVGGGAPTPPPVAGIPDPGPLTGWGLPIARVLSDLAAIGVVAGLLVPLLTMTAVGDEVRGRPYRALRSVRPFALLWALASLAQTVFIVSDLFAIPVWDLSFGLARDIAWQADQGRALLLQIVLAVVVAVASRFALTGREVLWLLVVTAVAITPPVFTGHAAAAGSHDLAILSLLVHLGAVSLWVGGLLALGWQLVDRPERRVLALRRFAPLATAAFVATAASGAANAVARLTTPEELVTTDYGRLVLVKVALLTALGLLGLRLRAVAPARAVRGESWFARVALGELTLMATAVGLGVALSRTPTPVGQPYITPAESLLGGPLPPTPTLARLLTEVRWSGVALLVCVGGGLLYAVGVRTLRRRGEAWPWGRSVSFAIGLLLVAYATAGGLGVYGHVLFSVHMVSHMVLSMLAPLFLVLGAPIVLALRALPGADVPGGTGPRQLLAGVLNSRPAHVLANPAIVVLLFVGSLYAVYLTGFYDSLMQSHLGHALMELHFLLAGLLYYEVLVGSAPLRRLPHLGRLLMVLLTMPFHAFFALAVMNGSEVIGSTYYRLLDRPYSADLLEDQNLGGSITWAMSELPLVVLVVVLLLQWWRADSRDAARYDRAADRDDDAALAAYNARLQTLGAARERAEAQRGSVTTAAVDTPDPES